MIKDIARRGLTLLSNNTKSTKRKRIEAGWLVKEERRGKKGEHGQAGCGLRDEVDE